MTSSWFFLSTLNYDALSTTHQIFNSKIVEKCEKQTLELQVLSIPKISMRNKNLKNITNQWKEVKFVLFRCLSLQTKLGFFPSFIKYVKCIKFVHKLPIQILSQYFIAILLYFCRPDACQSSVRCNGASHCVCTRNRVTKQPSNWSSLVNKSWDQIPRTVHNTNFTTTFIKT